MLQNARKTNAHEQNQNRTFDENEMAIKQIDTFLPPFPLHCFEFQFCKGYLIGEFTQITVTDAITAADGKVHRQNVCFETQRLLRFTKPA